MANTNSKMEENIIQMRKVISENTEKSLRLIEKWSSQSDRLKEAFVGLSDTGSLQKAMNLANYLENQNSYLMKFSEDTVSSAFKLSPQGVLNVIRLGYPNSVRGDIFNEVAMSLPNENIYYVKPVYSDSLRGATAGDTTYESSNYRYASELETGNFGTAQVASGTKTKVFTQTLATRPFRAGTVKILEGTEIVAYDNGSGGFLGSKVDATATNTINYTTGAATVTFKTGSEPNFNAQLTVQYRIDSEDLRDTQIGGIDLSIDTTQLSATQFPLNITWSNLTDLILMSSFSIDAEEILINAAAEELKKSLDYQAVRLAFQESTANTIITYDGTRSTGEGEVEKAQGVTRSFDEASDEIYSSVNRGTVNHVIASPSVARYLRLHESFDATNAQEAIGIHRIGTIHGTTIYKAPTNIIPANRVLYVYRNKGIPQDSAITFGTLYPLYVSDATQRTGLVKDASVAYFGDYKVINSDYVIQGNFTNF